MKVITNQELNDSYSKTARLEERNIQIFPHSVLVDGAFLEYDMAQKWLEENVGRREK